jgi:hypothetical protein
MSQLRRAPPRRVLEVLAIRDHRRFWIENFLSNIGSRMQKVALGWLFAPDLGSLSSFEVSHI